MEYREALLALRTFLSTQILGQEKLIDRLLIALLADGHMLVEGAPGLAKTKAIKELAEGIEAQFHRIQFTPDLLPADITGTEIYRPETGSFVFQQGPIFHNLVLADEINRAPAKVQSALLEAMAERQVSVGRSTYELSPLFLVMATPICLAASCAPMVSGGRSSRSRMRCAAAATCSTWISCAGSIQRMNTATC
jgi:MoxR-like ATPase